MKKIEADYDFKRVNYPAGDVRRDNFAELYNNAFGANGSANDLTITELAEWCDAYGNCWNGECWDASYNEASGSTNLWPVYEQWVDDDGEIDFVDIIGYNLYNR